MVIFFLNTALKTGCPGALIIEVRLQRVMLAVSKRHTVSYPVRDSLYLVASLYPEDVGVSFEKSRRRRNGEVFIQMRKIMELTQGQKIVTVTALALQALAKHPEIQPSPQNIPR